MSDFKVKLEQFEGPLDLLFNLIEEKKLDINTISLAKIAEDYLNYLKYFQEIDTANLANFLVLAARLILIKSKSLLPFLVLTEEEETEIKDLENKLALYRQYKEAAQLFKETIKKEYFSFSREFLQSEAPEFMPPQKMEAGKLKVILEKLFEEMPKIQPLEEKVVKEIITLQDKIKEIQTRLSQYLEENFDALMTERKTKTDVIISFLAILELIKQKFISAEQMGLFGKIRLIWIQNQ